MNFFREALRGTILEAHFREGLQALGKDSLKVGCENTRKLAGSVDIDSATEASCPNENRWDYAVGYLRGGNGKRLYFIEVHPASTSEVQCMIEKHRWLVAWLRANAAGLDRIPEKFFLWVASGGVRIPRNAPQIRKLAQEGISPPCERAYIC